MKQYDVKCPVCGTVNKGLYLEETGGNMICENCGKETRDMEYLMKDLISLPLLTASQVPGYLARKAV